MLVLKMNYDIPLYTTTPDQPQYSQFYPKAFGWIYEDRYDMVCRKLTFKLEDSLKIEIIPYICLNSSIALLFCVEGKRSRCHNNISAAPAPPCGCEEGFFAFHPGMCSRCLG